MLLPSSRIVRYRIDGTITNGNIVVSWNANENIMPVIGSDSLMLAIEFSEHPANHDRNDVGAVTARIDPTTYTANRVLRPKYSRL